MDPADLKAQGNAEYGKGNYRKALELYTTLIETLKASGEAVDPEQLSIAYRNRSAANVALYRFAAGLHDSIMSYNTLPTSNWKACLRAALCSCRTADLAAAVFWIERAKQHAPNPSNPVAAKAIQDMEDSIARKREFMSGGRFATEKLSEVIERLFDMIRKNFSNISDFPYLAYRIRTILRAHYSKISPDCEAFDIKLHAATETASQVRAMQVAIQSMATTGEYEKFAIASMTDLCLRMDFISWRLTYHKDTFQPDTSLLKRLLRVPGCEDIFLSDLPDTTPQQAAYWEGEFDWEKKFVLGEAEGPRPKQPSLKEAGALQVDMAANIFSQLTLRVLEGLTSVRTGVLAQRSFQQLATIHSRRLYRLTCDECLTHCLRLDLQHPAKVSVSSTGLAANGSRDLARGLVANGGLKGLCLDVSDANWPEGFKNVSFLKPLEFITIDNYRDVPVEEVADAIECLGDKIHEYLSETTCKKCLQDCSKEDMSTIAQIFVRMYSAHGARPFLMAARFTASINFCVSKMWHFSCCSETPTSACATANSALDPSKSQTWLSLINKWGALHPGKQAYYCRQSVLPSRIPRVIRDSHQMNKCDNSLGCNGSRAVFGDDGLRVLRLCGKCQRMAYCSKECQTEDWARHKAECSKLQEGGGRAECHCRPALSDR